jgi:hypothetical protein
VVDVAGQLIATGHVTTPPATGSPAPSASPAAS